MSIGFTGTQIGLSQKQKEVLWSVLKKFVQIDKSFRHGDCIGADAEAHAIAVDLGFKVTLHPPKENSKRSFCKQAVVLPTKDYLDRNKDIVNASKVLIACPKGVQEEVRSGTWATVRYARKIKKDLIIILIDGRIQKEIYSSNLCNTPSL